MIAPYDRGVVRSMVIAIVSGAVAALIAAALFSVVPSPWDSLINTSALWGLVPFVVASRSQAAVLSGVVSMVALVAGWIVFAPVTVTSREVAVFVVVGAVAGAICGAAGGSRRRLIGTTVMSGLVMGEALYGAVIVGGPQWYLEAVVAVLISMVRGNAARARLLPVVGAVVLAAMLFGCFLAYDAILASS